MADVDRTDELIDAMLSRRAGQPMPDGLASRTMAAVAGQPQARPGRRARVGLPSAVGIRTAVVAIVAAVALVAVGLVAGSAVINLWRGGGGLVTTPVPGVVPTATASYGPAASPDEPPSTPPGTPGPTAAAIMPDALAVVTSAGDRLRVRTAPGVGADSIKLKPLLDPGTRLLVLGGPVRADGYDWYEVVVEDQPDMMYGWVAAADEGIAWIKPIEASCRGVPDGQAAAEMAAFDFLVCYHAQPVVLGARWNEGQDGSDVACPWTSAASCTVAEGWLLARRYVSYQAPDGTTHTIGLAVPPAMQSAVDALPADGAMTLTIAMDAPEARSCRITDPGTGDDLVQPDRVITACRLAFVVRAVTPGP